jgi:multimeric flavodoxin WrbA
MVDAILEGAANEGAEVFKVNLGDLCIAPCRSCDYCQKESDCVQDDDMGQVKDLMEKSDVWILGSPVYWWSASAQMKAFIDRWYGLDHRVFSNKDVVLAIPMGGSDKRYARHVLGMFKSIFNYLGMNHAGTVLAASMTSRNSARERSTLLDEARSLGACIATEATSHGQKPHLIEYPA